MSRIKKLAARALLACITLAALGIALVAVRSWLLGRQAEAKIAALRSEGEPVTLVDLAREPISPEQNGASYLRRARHDLESLDNEWVAVDDAERRWLKEQGKSETEIFELLGVEDWPNAWRQKAFAATFDAYPSVMPLLERAAACDDFDWQYDYTVRPDRLMDRINEDCQLKRRTARALRNRAELQASQGKSDEAIQTCIVLLRLTRLYDKSPTMINHLVNLGGRGMAIYDANSILQRLPTSAQTRSELREELALHESLEPLRHALITERTYGLGCFRDITPQSWGLNADLNSFLVLMHRQLAQVGAPFDSTVIASNPPDGTLTASAQVICQTGQVSECNLRAQVRCLQVILALLDQSIAPQSPVPKIEDLNLAAQTITDPFSGNKLQLKKVGNGWLIYSVGGNLKDDGGDIENGLDIGVRPPGRLAQ